MTSDKMPTILAVDDLQDNLDLIRQILEDEPYEVITACDAETALKLAREKQPDVAVLDVQMPVVDGYELCRQLLEETAPAHIPILFLTAHRTTAQDAVRGLDLGARDYVTKPYDADELRARVRALIRVQAEHDQDISTAKRVTRRLLGR